MAVCQNLVHLVNIKIAGKWMFIPLKMVLIGIDPYPYPNFGDRHGHLHINPSAGSLPTTVTFLEPTTGTWEPGENGRLSPWKDLVGGIEHGHRNSGFCHEKWWFSIVMLVPSPGWWYTYLPLWKIWKSVGIIIPNRMGKIKHLPTHQPEIDNDTARWLENPSKWGSVSWDCVKSPSFAAKNEQFRLF